MSCTNSRHRRRARRTKSRNPPSGRALEGGIRVVWLFVSSGSINYAIASSRDLANNETPRERQYGPFDPVINCKRKLREDAFVNIAVHDRISEWIFANLVEHF